MTLGEQSHPCVVDPPENASAESMSWGRLVSGESSGRSLLMVMLEDTLGESYPVTGVQLLINWSPIQ